MIMKSYMFPRKIEKSLIAGKGGLQFILFWLERVSWDQGQTLGHKRDLNASNMN